jgi:hypothetical protein
MSGSHDPWRSYNAESRGPKDRARISHSEGPEVFEESVQLPIRVREAEGEIGGHLRSRMSSFELGAHAPIEGGPKGGKLLARDF